MTKKEMVERSRKALAEFNKLPPEVHAKELMAHGTINEKGEVLLGREVDAEGKRRRGRSARSSASPDLAASGWSSISSTREPPSSIEQGSSGPEKCEQLCVRVPGFFDRYMRL
jgi:hypothetical protein